MKTNLTRFRSGIFAGLAVVLGFLTGAANAQVTGYVPSTDVTTLTPIVGGTTLGGDANDEFYWSGDAITPFFENDGLNNYLLPSVPGFPIGFNFTLGGNSYDRFSVCDNGYIQLHSSANAGSSLSQGYSSFSATAPFTSSSTNARNVIAALMRDIQASATPGASSLKFITTGSFPSRKLTVEWLNYRNFGGVGQDFDFQIVLNETSNTVEIIYNGLTNASGTNITASAGIRGFGGNTDFRKYTCAPTATTMDAPNVATVNNQTIGFRNGFNPTNGRRYTFTPGGVVCSGPVGLTATVVGSAINIAWTAPGGVTNYEVDYRALPSGTFAAASGSPTAATSLNITGLSAATSYEVRVRSNCGGGNFSQYLTFQRTIPGPGENCALAISASVAANAGACVNTTANKGLANDGGNVLCVASPPGDDIYYSFVAPSDGSKLVIETFQNGANDVDWALEVYDACGGALVACNDDRDGGAGDYSPYVEICAGDYTNGATYYLRLSRWSFNTGNAIDFCIYKDVACPPVPANNTCASATPVTLGVYGDCPAGATQFTTIGATPDAITNPSCDPFGTINDVWISFNSGLNTAVTFTYSLTSATSVKAAVYTACGSGIFGGLCWTAPGTYSIQGLTPSTNYLIRLWSNSAGVAGTFDVCLQETPNCPGGLGTGLFNVPSVPYFTGSQSTCGQADDIQSGAVLACGSANYLSAEDVVYQFQVPSNGSYQILLSTNSSWAGLKLYAGCPLAGRGGSCVANVGSSAANKSLNGLLLTTGVDYYLIIDQWAPPSCMSEYQLTIQATPPPPVNDDCGVNATTLVQQSTCSYYTDSYSGSATPSSPAACPGGTVADDDVWFKFVALSSNPEITVAPSPGYYPVLELFSSCAGTSLCCVFADATGGTVKMIPPTPLTPGNTYYLRVYHAFAGAPTTNDFDICVANGPVEASCLTVPGGAVAEAEACGTSSNGLPGFETITDGQTRNGTVWAECNSRDLDYYRITTAAPGWVVFTVNSEFPATVAVFSETAGAPGAQLASNSVSQYCSGNMEVAFPSSQPAGNYYVLVTPATFRGIPCGSQRNEYIVTATYTSTPPAPPANDNCANAITLIPCGPGANGRTLSATTQVAPIVCAGDQSNYARDVFYKFTAIATQHTINVTGNFDGVLDIRTGTCPGVTVNCSDVVGNNESITMTTTVGLTYYIRYYAYGVSDPPPGNFSVSVTTTGGWSGQTSTDWGTASNWCSGSVPGVGTNVTITNVPNVPTMVTAGNCNNITLLPGSTVVTTPNSLNIKGNLQGSGNTLTGTSPVIFSGASGQIISGSVNFNSLRLSNTTLAGVSVANGANVNLNGVMTIDPNARLVNTGTGTVTVVSNATTEGSIGVVGTGGQINGNINVQRYVPFTGPGWHFFSTSVSGNNYGQWTDDFKMSALPPVGGANGVVAFTEPERSTIFQYNEAAHNVKLDTVQKDGWRVPSSSTISVGRGYRVFMTPGYFSNNPSNIIDNVGTVTLGNAGAGFSFPSLTRNEYSPCYPTTVGFNPTVCNESNRGWNLIANPFPSNLNWDAAGWTKPGQMNNAFFIWNSAGGGYQVYVGSGGVALGQNASTVTNPNIIPKSQGFFVRLTTPGSYSATLQASESVKSATTGQFVRTAVVQNQLKVRISKPTLAGISFDAMVRFMDGATDAFDQHKDAHLLTGSNASVGFVVGNENMIMSSYAPLNGTAKTIPMKTFYAGQVGTYQLAFLEQETFPVTQHIYLKDKFLNALVDIKANPVYSFSVAFANNSNTNDRFELVFSPNAITEVKPAILDGTSFSIFPNPTDGKKAVAYVTGSVDEKVTISVVDMLGKVVYTKDLTILADGEGQHEIDADLAAGVYNVTCVGKSKVLTTKMVVN